MKDTYQISDAVFEEGRITAKYLQSVYVGRGYEDEIIYEEPDNPDVKTVRFEPKELVGSFGAEEFEIHQPNGDFDEMFNELVDIIGRDAAEKVVESFPEDVMMEVPEEYEEYVVADSIEVTLEGEYEEGSSELVLEWVS